LTTWYILTALIGRNYTLGDRYSLYIVSPSLVGNNKPTAKFLEITIDSNLDFNYHIKQLETKLVKSVGILRKVKLFLTLNSLRQIYFAIFQSHLQYGLIVWGNTYKSYLNKLCTLQNKAIKIIGGGTWRESAIPYYSKFKILKLQDLYLLELATFMFKFKTKQLPFNFINYFGQLKIIHTKNIRSSQSNNYFLPRYKAFKLQKIN